MAKLYIKQDKESTNCIVACRVITDDDPQIQLIPGENVKVADCDSGKHQLRVGVILNQGSQKVTLTLVGGRHNDASEIVDIFHAPTDGSLYYIEVE